MTRSLILLIQIVLHAIPACLSGRLLTEFVRVSAGLGGQSPSIVVLYTGCLFASCLWVGLHSSALHDSDRRAATICALGIPFTGAFLWLILYFRGNVASALFGALVAMALTLFFSVPIQIGFGPVVARWCRIAQGWDAQRLKSLHGRPVDRFEIPLLVLVNALPALFLIAAYRWRVEGMPVYMSMRVWLPAILLASCVWVGPLKRYVTGASGWKQGAAAASAGFLVPFFASVLGLAAGFHLPLTIAVTLSAKCAFASAVVTLPAHVLLSGLLFRREWKIPALKARHA